MPARRPIRVLVVDEHPTSRAGIEAILDGVDGVQLVGLVRRCEEASEAAKRLRPDVVVLDCVGDHDACLQGVRTIRAQSPLTRVLLLTLETERGRDLRAAGVDELVEKTLPADALVEAIRRQGERGRVPRGSRRPKLVENL